jgi:hypothetical protein
LYIVPESEYKCQQLACQVDIAGDCKWVREMEKLRHRLVWLPLFVGMGALPALTGCNSKSFALDDGIPNTAPPAVISQSRTAPPPGPIVQRKTGTYPTFDRTLTAANEQIEDADYQKTEPRLAALARARKTGSISEAEYNRRVTEYRKLAADHGKDALTDIAN